MKWLGAFYFLFVAVSSVMLAQPTFAVTASDWKAGNIIDDASFTNSSDMSVSQIQNWLDSRLKNCDYYGSKTSELAGGIDYNGDGRVSRAEYGKTKGNPAPFTCLNKYYEVPKTQPGSGIPASNYGKSTIPTGAKSAARLIYDAAQTYKISPKVLLVKLGTESAGPLTSDPWPFKIQYTYAMGARCPDSGPGGSANCDSNYAGFSLQMHEAAKLLRWYLDSMNASWWSYKKPYETNYILWNVDPSRCGGSNVYIQNKATAALYTYTPYQPNNAALQNMYGLGNSCSAYGNRNFWRVYHDWFGNPLRYYAFKGSSSASVYLYLDGYKASVPSMALLQDYGYSPGSIRVLPQSTANSIPNADTSPDALSAGIGFLTKSPSDSDGDGGSLYFVTIGKKYAVKDMGQYSEFGFKSSDIKKLPIDYIENMPNGGTLADFIASPTSNVFQVMSGQKNIIFTYKKYAELNTSGKITRMSHYGVSRIAGGKPIADGGVFIRKPNGSVYYYEPASGNYHGIPNMNTFNCWGVGKKLVAPYYQIAKSDYIKSFVSASSMSCVVKNSAGDSHLVDQNVKYPIPANFNFTSSTSHADLVTLAGSLNTSSTSLSRVVKKDSSAGVWYIENGNRRPISSLHNLVLLGYNGGDIDILSSASLNSIPVLNVKKLGSGLVVKSSGSNSVYAIHNDSRVGIGSAALFSALGYKWGDLETHSKSFLDSAYPASTESLNRYIAAPDKQSVVYFGPSKCYTVSDTVLQHYGQIKTNITSKTYNTTVLGNAFSAGSCVTMTVYAKSDESTTVYKVENGEKRAFSSWQAYSTSNTNSDPITVVDPSNLSSLSTGPTL